MNVLAIRPSLPAGTYAFVLTATRAGAASSASVTVIINEPPRNGYVVAFPARGVELSTQFSITTAGWVDAVTVTMHPRTSSRRTHVIPFVLRSFI